MFSLRVQSQDGPRSLECEGASTSELEDHQPTEMCFTSGNPTVVHGKVHLYRPTSLSADQVPPEKPGTSRQVCILAVPAGMGVPEFCQFVGAYLPKVAELRFLRGDRGGSMALLLFDAEATAAEFIEVYDGRKFNTLEPEVCRAVLVSSVEFTSVDDGAAPGTSAAPPHGQTELPNCPVCLERLDQHVSGITTTVCQHNFHTDCLKKWTDSSCPVCRYCHEEAETSACMVCGNNEDLWICLICGYVGCGRYQNKHSVAHWQETQHCYSLELATQRVWDYVGDNYVHRLIQTSTDGKLVELPSPQMERGGGGSGGEGCSGDGGGADGEVAKAMLSSKIEAVAFEYNHLLTSQLESQRMYYEGLLKLAEEEVARARGREARLEGRLVESEEAARSEAKENRELERKKGQLERRLEEALRGKEEVAKEKDFLKQLSDSLIGNQKEWQRKVQEATAAESAKSEEVKDLEEQVRDLMVFIEAQSTLKNAEGSSELQDGTVLGVSPSPESVRRRGKGRAR